MSDGEAEMSELSDSYSDANGFDDDEEMQDGPLLLSRQVDSCVSIALPPKS